ncbi:MAG: sugar transferase [Nitrospirota bacterium]|nr:MAG: sugar transferase [Nitrospirota bacterium]
MKCKRLFDITVSSFLAVILSPLLLLIAAIVYFDLGPPIIFTQVRPGRNGVPFRIYKFRTMNEEIDDDGVLLNDVKRISKIGRFMRSTSLDELPELFNVIKGDMSIVGPRPLLMEYLPLYSNEQARRHEVRPGITGWAQVNGRNAISWEDKFRLDVWYIDNRSFWLDLKILFITFVKVVIREGISQDRDTTMTRFEGVEKDNE